MRAHSHGFWFFAEDMKRAGAGGESASNFALLFLHVFYTFFLKVWIFE